MRLRSLVVTLLLTPLATAAMPLGDCAVSGLTTADFGSPSPIFGGPTLSLGWDPGDCALVVDLDAPACCNTFVTGHFLLLGFQALPQPLPLQQPFFPGSNLLISPDVLLGPFDGLSALLPIQPTPDFVGLTFFAQGVPIYFTTIGLTTDLATTQAVAAIFQ